MKDKIKKILGKEKIKNDRKFSTLDDWDSLAHMKFITNIEKNFKIKLSTMDILKINNINSCIKIIKKNANKKK